MPHLPVRKCGARLLLGALLPVAIAGCASVGARDPQAAVARLERARARAPQSLQVQRALGIALYKAQRFPEARRQLDDVRQAAPRDGVAALYSGLAAEAQGDLTGARDAYAAFLGAGGSPTATARIRERLAYVSRLALVQEAQRAVAAESQVGAAPGSPTTVAVPPFRFAGRDSSLRPLERGLADLMITDLARAASLTLVERERMQAIVDELARAESGRVDEATAVRAGRLLRAGRVVQGGITQGQADALQLAAAVVDVPTAQGIGGGSADDVLDRLFEMEKRLALEVLQSLGIQLSAADRALLQQVPTRSLPAFLAYSRGLEAEDRGDFAAAAGHYREARTLDPSFRAAAQREQGAALAAGGAGTGPLPTGLATLTGPGPFSGATTTFEATLTGTTEAIIGAGAAAGVPTPQLPSPLPAVPSIGTLNPSAGGAQTGAPEPATGILTPGTSAAPSSPAPTVVTGQNPPTAATPGGGIGIIRGIIDVIIRLP
jgi:tetratricopeptide (TPR) repeat protein